MRRLNVKLLAWLVGGSLVLLVGVVLVHGYQVERNSGLLLTQAQDARKEGNLSEAAKYYSQYLNHRDDAKAYAELAEVMVEIAKAPDASSRDRNSAYSTLETAVRLHPELKDARKKLIEYSMILGRFHDARDHIRFLKEAGADEPELDLRLAECLAAVDERDQALAILYKLIGFDEKTQKFDIKTATGPKEVGAYTQLATLLRRFKNSPELADLVMDQCVSNNPDSYSAYLNRGMYKQQFYTVKDAKPDFMKALELKPDDSGTIIRAAYAMMLEDENDEALKLLEGGVKQHPKLENMYMALSRVLAKQDKVDEAIAQLKKGLELLPKSAGLLVDLSTLQLQKGDFAGSRATVEKMVEVGVVPEVIAFYSARVLVAEKKWREASRSLEKVRPLLATRPELQFQTNMLLGRCYLFLGQPDRQKRAFQDALKLDPSSVEARLGLAQAEAQVGRGSRAVELLSTVDDDAANPAVQRVIRNSSLQVKIAAELRKPAKERSWADIDGIVESMLTGTELKDFQKSLVRAEMAMLKDQLPEAKRILNELRKQHPKELTVWLSMLKLVEREGKPELIPQVLDVAQKSLGDTVPLRVVRINWLMTQEADFAKAELAKLEAGADGFTPDHQLLLYSELGKAYHQLRDYPNVKRCWKQVAEQQSDNATVHKMMFDMALVYGDVEGMASTITEIQRIEGDNGENYKYCRAQQIIWEVGTKRKEASAVNEAERLVAEVRATRPDWHELARLQGQIDLIQGDVDAAIEQFQSALELGPPNPNVARRLVQLLYLKGRPIDAQKYVSQVGQLNPDDPLQRVRVELLLKNGKTEEALALAKDFLDADANSAENYLWLGQIYLQMGQPDEAEKAYRNAVQKDPKSPMGWLMLVQYLVATEQKTALEAVLREAALALPEKEAPMVLAQCNEIAGNAQAAEEHYQAALAANPNNPGMLRSVATFYLRAGQPERAGEYLEQILKVDVKAGDPQFDHVTWARRAKAKVMADKGDFKSLQAAIQLIEQNRTNDKLPADDLVVLASLFGARPEAALRSKAAQMLEQLREQRPLSNDEQLGLAQLYEQTGQWPKARSEMTTLLSRATDNPTYLAAFAKMLLQHNEATDVPSYVQKLEELQPQASTTIQLRAWLLVKQGQTSQAVELLEGLVPRPLAPEQIGVLANTALIMEELELYEAAEKMLREYQAQEPRAILLLANFLGRHGSFQEAFALFEEARKSQPISRIVQASLGALRAQPNEVTESHYQKVEGWINDGLTEDPNSVNLKLQLAELRDIQGRYADVVKIYRDFLATSDDEWQKAIVKNNLAFIIAMSPEKMGEPEEAMTMIQESISVLGMTADLLDTRAMVHMSQGELQKALRDVRAAIAEAPTANKYFHLALLEHRAKSTSAAVQAMKRAKAMKIDRRDLPRLEHRLFDQVTRELDI